MVPRVLRLEQHSFLHEARRRHQLVHDDVIHVATLDERYDAFVGDGNNTFQSYK